MSCHNKRPDPFGWGIAAIIAAVFIYHFHKYLLIALAIFGLWFIFECWNRNNRKGPPRC